MSFRQAASPRTYAGYRQEILLPKSCRGPKSRNREQQAYRYSPIPLGIRIERILVLCGDV
jgi:hypothetical protein